MASVYPRGGKWWISYTDPGTGKREQRALPDNVTTEAQARAWKRDIERATDTGAVEVPGLGTLEDAIEDFLRDKHERREPATAAFYDKIANRWREHMPVRKAVAEIGPPHISAYMNARARLVGKGTVNAERRGLLVLWNWMIRRGLARENPVMRVEPFSVRAAPKVSTSEAEYRACVKALRDDAATCPEAPDAWIRTLYADILETVWWTGLRVGEVCRIAPGDVDTRAWTASVRSAPNKGPRLAPIEVPALRRIFKRHLARGKAFVFALHDGGHALGSLYTFRGRWKKKNPGHDRALRFHLSRHAVSDRLRERGVDIIVRSRGVLGHTNVQMTAHYSHEHLDELRDAQRSLMRPSAKRRGPRKKRGR